jgi:ABC-type antimicrobial peptide transport system permease subunit
MVEGSPNFFKVYGLVLAEGNLPELTMMEEYFFPNEATMKALGYKHMENAFIRSDRPLINRIIDGSSVHWGTSLFPVQAVVKNYYNGHLTEGIKPMVFRMSGDSGVGPGKFYIRIRAGKEQVVIDFLKKSVMEVYGTDEIKYTWMSDQVAAIYDEDRQVATIYTVFALIAIAVSCLGLFGISLFDIRQRYREIGIRKVNGAGMKDLYKLLFRKYVTVLVIAFVIAIPLAYYAVHTYTADFVVKASLGIDVFVIALLIVALISLGTLFWQVRKAASINPSEVMKSE